MLKPSLSKNSSETILSILGGVEGKGHYTILVFSKISLDLGTKSYARERFTKLSKHFQVSRIEVKIIIKNSKESKSLQNKMA